MVEMLDERGHNLPIGTICIEDLEIGMTRSLSKTIGDREIEMFAELSTDHNPVHLDDAYARDTIFAGRIAHGMLTAGLISAVIGEQLPGHGTVYLGQSLKFMAPVRPGDRVEAVIHWDRIPEETEFKEIPPNVRALLRYSEGAHVRWVDQDQVHWQVYFFRWDAGAVSSHVNVHRPEVCLPSAGFKMEGRNAEFTWPLDTINLEFNQYLFTAPKVELHVFYAMWDDEPDQSVPLGSTGRERLEQVWQGQRIEGRYSVQFILANVRSAQTARAKVKGFLSRSLRVKE